jgi:hypothetical protein
MKLHALQATEALFEQNKKGATRRKTLIALFSLTPKSTNMFHDDQLL